jgi:hypothetical protein
MPDPSIFYRFGMREGETTRIDETEYAAAAAYIQAAVS